MRKSLVTAIPLFSAVVLFAACASKKPAVVATVNVDAGAAPADAGYAAPSDAGAPATATDAGAPFFTGDGGIAGAVTALGDAALDAAIDLAINAAASKVAPKMEKEGQPGRATLKEGEHWGMVVNLQPNRCYTIVANSPPGNVEKLDLKLYGPAPLLTTEAGKSGASDKNTPVIGKGTAALCPVLPLAVPYKIDAAATKGAGRIGIVVYSRAK
jgi:hypothetical protein